MKRNSKILLIISLCLILFIILTCDFIKINYSEWFALKGETVILDSTAPNPFICPYNCTAMITVIGGGGGGYYGAPTEDGLGGEAGQVVVAERFLEGGNSYMFTLGIAGAVSSVGGASQFTVAESPIPDYITANGGMMLEYSRLGRSNGTPYGKGGDGGVAPDNIPGPTVGQPGIIILHLLKEQ